MRRFRSQYLTLALHRSNPNLKSRIPRFCSARFLPWAKTGTVHKENTKLLRGIAGQELPTPKPETLMQKTLCLICQTCRLIASKPNYHNPARLFTCFAISCYFPVNSLRKEIYKKLGRKPPRRPSSIVSTIAASYSSVGFFCFLGKLIWSRSLRRYNE